MFQEIYKQNIQ